MRLQWVSPLLVLMLCGGLTVNVNAATDTNSAEVALAIDVVVINPVPKQASALVFKTTAQVEPTFVHTEIAVTDGIVESILAEGTEFAKGASLLKLNLKQKQLELAALISDLKFFQQEVDIMTAKVGRYETLVATEVSDQDSLESALLTLFKAKSELESTKTQIELLQWLIDQSRHVVEFAGKVSLRHVSIGASVVKGTPLLDIVSTYNRRVVFDLPNSLAYQPIDIELVHHTKTKVLTEYNITPKANNRTVSFQVNADVSELPVKLGELVIVVVKPRINRTIFALPREAVFDQGKEKAIFTVDPQNKAVVQLIDIVEQSTSDYLVSSETLSAGDLVIIKGHAYLKKGQVVNFKRSENGK